MLLSKRDESKMGHGQGLTAETTLYSADWSLKPSCLGLRVQH